MTPPPKVQIQSEHAKVTCKKKEERYKAKIEGYVPRFHTKYFNHAISVILPFCFAKIKSTGQLHKSNVGSLGWQTAEAAGDRVGHSNEAAATFVLRQR